MKTTIIVILTMLGLWVFAEYWPWRIGGYQAPGLPQRRPRRPWRPERDDYWGALEALLDDEDRLTEAAAAEQEARHP